MIGEGADIVITGLGAVSPYGTGVAAFRAGLAAGRPCTQTVTDGGRFRGGALRAAVCEAFTPDDFDASAGFSRLPRGTQMSIVAADEALRDGRLALEGGGHSRIGVFFASARTALEKTEKFYQSLLEKGPRLVNPLAFQETVSNAPVAHLCLRYKITGPGLAFAGGGTAGLQALATAADWLRAGRVDLALVVAAESIPPVSLVCHSHVRGHAPVDPHGVSEPCPFDERRNGYVFGEGAVAALLETGAHAQGRGASARAVISACHLGHEPGPVGRFGPEGAGLERTMRGALAAGAVEPSAVEWILADARSSRAGDAAEAKAIGRVFGAGAASPPVTAIKSLIGETEAAAPAFNLLAAVTGMEDGLLYKTANYWDPDDACDVNLVAGEPLQRCVATVLIDATWYGGASGALVIHSSRPSRSEA